MTIVARSDCDRPPLVEAELQRALVVPGGVWTALRVVGRTESTNADLAAAGRTGVPEGHVLVAEEQVSGRGRLGRAWQSPPRAGLAVSVLLRPGLPTRGWPAGAADRFGWLPLLTGVAVVHAVRRVTGVEAVLKWPNDVMIGDRKCGGILAELVVCGPDGEPGPPSAVVVGLGLNTTLRRPELPQPMATSLVLEGATDLDRSTVLRAVLRDLAGWYTRWRACGGDPDRSGLRQMYAECCATLGASVRVLLPGGDTLDGIAEGVDGEGRLMISDTAGGHRVLAVGDVAHVRPSGSRGGSDGFSSDSPYQR
ncbi:MAG: biotin--[acetyl-CoA-carboxylase] ligase [Dactylosporangium sp.]|nr:biotin--[acetyl-CoA-carboxylase] ligase [Dactylosporangium sp.]NNJ62093.1 biotin--[acetyl-CoA-carboxylase] ligase [Dactylosporangium sp.]